MKKILLAVMAVAITLGATTTSASAATGFARDGAFAVQGTDGGAVHQRRIAVDHTSGDVYVADQQNDRVSVYRPTGGGGADLLTSFGSGELTDPYGIAIDQGSGTVYVSDVDGVTRYDSDGAATPVFTLDATFGPIVASGPLSFDQVADQLLLADTGANVVRRYSAAGAPLAVFDGSAGLGSPGAFTGLQDLAVDSTGDIVVIDAQGDPGTGGTSRIERFDNGGAWEATIGPVDQAATVGIVPATDEVIVSGNQDSVNDDSLPTLQRFATDGTDLGPITIDDSLRYSTISGIAADDGAGGSLFVASDVSAGSYVGQYGTVSVQTYAAVEAPTASIASVTGVGQTVATLHGTANPQGEAATYRFELSSDAGVTWTAAAGPDGDPAVDDSAGNATSDTPVQTTATGLEPNTPYQVRLVVTSRAGSATTGPETFTTDAAPPAATTTAASGITNTSAKLNGRVDPQGSPTTYWFEYGTTTSYGASTPVAQNGDAGAGNAPIDVTRTITGLDPATTYHYRLVAQNAQGTTHGTDHSLQPRAAATPTAADSCSNAEVRAQQGTSYLPDCRAYELVSPQDKGAANGARPDIPALLSADGDAASYYASDGFAGAPSGAMNAYQAARDARGRWATSPLSPALDPEDVADGGAAVQPVAWSVDGSTALMKQGTHSVRPDVPGGYDRALYLRHVGGPLRWVTEPVVALSHPADWYYAVGASEDLAHVVFQGQPADPQNDTPRLVPEDAARLQGAGLYEWRADGSLRAVGVLPDGSIPQHGATAPRVSGTVITASEANNQVSADGRRIVFRTPDPGTGASEVSRLYQRIDGERTVLISRSSITGNPATEASTFGYASPDGSVVWFTSAEQLTADAPPGAGGVYRFDVDTEDLSYEPEVAEAPLVSSDDGRRFLYIKAGTDDLWLRNGSADTEVAADVDATLRGAPGARQVRSTPDGSRFLFLSEGQVSPGMFVNGSGDRQVYLYDVDASALTCVSCPSEGQASAGGASISVTHNLPSGLNEPRALSADGKRVFFSTPTGLVDRDVNARFDVYQWLDGQLALLSTGTAAQDAVFNDADENGDTVLFLSGDETLPDAPGGASLYVARSNGGTLRPPGREDCGLDCQGPPADQPSASPPASMGVTGAPGKVVTRPSITVRPMSSSARRSVARHGRLSLTIRSSVPTTLTVIGKATLGGRRATVARATRRLSKAGIVTMRLPLSHAARTRLRAGHSLRLAVAVSAPGARAQTLTVLLPGAPR